MKGWWEENVDGVEERGERQKAMPFDPPAYTPVRSPVRAPSPADYSRLEAIWARFVGKSPTILYYDHVALGETCGDLPIRRWTVDSKCSLLLLRSGTERYKDGLSEANTFFATSLRLDSFDSWLLCFVKQHKSDLARRFDRLKQNCRSFRSLVEVVARLICVKEDIHALVLSNDSDDLLKRWTSLSDELIFCSATGLITYL
ncbi:hypothetical protein M3Y99_01254000 [Aphelenchoides fujianensis]|nr:hypothetical protein M3Y99_01254000 [Aphelenchoides fujianensis]